MSGVAAHIAGPVVHWLMVPARVVNWDMMMGKGLLTMPGVP